MGKEDRKQILSVYWLDEGHVPPVYVLKCPEVPDDADVPDEEIVDPDAEKEKEEKLEESTIQSITNLLWLNSTSDFQRTYLKSGYIPVINLYTTIIQSPLMKLSHHYILKIGKM